ncbi:sensor histidine kinase [Pontibacter qinzhouensis]|nr:HAMP domain-containing sensor histidine kinase [Pontibacter qinzhouensis]
MVKADALFYNSLFLFLVSAVTWPLATLLQKNYRKHANLSQQFCVLYAVLFISSCMAVSFIAQNNPKNNMTMYLLGVLCAAVFFVFSLKEVLVLMVLVSLNFSIGLWLCSLTLEQEVLNSFGSIFILTCFFFISRVIYSYRLHHHMQVKLIKAQQRKIQKISSAKSEILRIVAHDMRAPFANIEMLVTLLRKRKGMAPEKQEEFYDLILKSCYKSKGLIADLLELAQLEQNQELKTNQVNVYAFLQEVQAEWKQKLTHNKQLLFSLPEKDLFVNLHLQKFQRVLDNLISNAVKFTPENGLIQVQVKENGQNIEIKISDNGIGVPLHLQQHLFKPFSKAGRKGLNGEASVGLGLNISRKLVEQHGGSITVESEENQGTTFQIKLPLAQRA